MTILPSRPEPAHVHEARRVLRKAREKAGLAGGGVAVVGLAAGAAGFAAALPATAVVLALVAVGYHLPLSSHIESARRTMREWQSGGSPHLDDADDTTAAVIAPAEAMAHRIEEYCGATAPSTAAARAMLQLLYDSTEDLAAVELLRVNGSRADFQKRADSLTLRVQQRMDQAVAVIADIYEAVLSQDDIALREIVAKADAEARRMHAEAEVGALLQRRVSEGR